MHPNNQQPTTMSMTIEILSQRVEALEKQLALLLENNTKEVTEKKSKKSKKPKKDDSSDDEEKPKTKRVSGYILFSNATRDEVRDSLSKGEEKPKNTDIMKELARLWKELSDEDKEPWNAKAKELKDAA
jgi:upstream-binding transcription factor